MRTLADAGLRTDYLSSLVVPKGRLIVDRWLPRFESALHSSYDNGVIVGSTKIADDYFDTDADNHWLWGDSDRVTSGGSFSGICRVVAPHLVTADSTSFYKSWWTVASPSWTFSATAALPDGRSIARYCRPGVRDKGDGTIYVWFLKSAATPIICRAVYNPATNAWGTVTETTADFTGGLRSMAIHPVADDQCVVFSLVDNRFMITVLMGVGGGSYYRRNLVLGLSEDYPDDMAVWSDAEKVPSDTTRIVAMCNMTRWPIPRSVRIAVRGTKCVIGTPRMAVPADPDWGNMRVKPISLGAIGNYLEAVLYREPIDSMGNPISPHTILASSYNGHGWHEDVLVTRADCRGKFVYAGSGQYGYVVGNVTVARCTAGAQQGSDYSGITQILGTVTSLSLSHDGPGSAPSIQATIPDPDNTFLATGLVAPANRVRIYLGDDRLTSDGFGLIYTGEITDVTPSRAPGSISLAISALGMSQRVFGDGSYKPASSINLLAPRSEQSRFQFETGEARLTVIAKDGTWETVDNDESGGYLLQCEAGGTVLFAEELTNPQFFARFRMRYRTKLRGAYVLFWYEDENNYYRAGLRNTEAAGGWLEIDRCVDGVVTNLVSETLAALVAKDTWFTLMLSCTANNLTVYYMDGGEYDYSTAYDSATYPLDSDETGAPDTYSLGLQLTEFDPLNSDSDVRTAYYVGTVTDADADWLEDTGYTWTGQQAESYLYVGDAYHKIASYDTETQKYTIEDYWGEAPSVGSSYGIVAGWLVPGPTLQVYSAFFCEMIRPMSAEDIGTWVLDACGVVRDWGSTSTLPQFDTGGSAVFMRDVQIDVVGTPTAVDGPEIVIWARSQRKDADSSKDATAMRIKLYSDRASADYTRVSGAASSWISVHPYPAYSTLESGTEYQFRVQACKEGIYVSVGDRLLAAFPVGLGVETFIASEGFCGYLSGSGTYREFPAVTDVTWDTAENASSFLSRVFQGFNLRPIERADGSMRLGRQYDPLGDLGEWYATVTKLETQKTRSKAALLELAGAENLTFYLNESQAYDSLTFDRQDNPNLWSIPALEFEAKRLSERAEEQQTISRVTLHAPDPAAEVDDRVEVDGEPYRIEGVKMSLSRGMNDLKFDASFKARLEDLDHFTAGVWGTSVWGAFQWGE